MISVPKVSQQCESPPLSKLSPAFLTISTRGPETAMLVRVDCELPESIPEPFRLIPAIAEAKPVHLAKS
jgi:hypothetical protein